MGVKSGRINVAVKEWYLDKWVRELLHDLVANIRLSVEKYDDKITLQAEIENTDKAQEIVEAAVKASLDDYLKNVFDTDAEWTFHEYGLRIHVVGSSYENPDVDVVIPYRRIRIEDNAHSWAAFRNWMAIEEKESAGDSKRD